MNERKNGRLFVNFQLVTHTEKASQIGKSDNMISESTSRVFQVIFVVCILSLGVGIINASPRISVLRAMNSGWRHLARNRTPTGPCFSGGRAFTYYLAADHSTKQFMPTQSPWNRSFTQWAPTPWGNKSEISNTNDIDDRDKTPKLINEGGANIASTPSNGLKDLIETDNQHSTQKLIDAGNSSIATRSEIHDQSDVPEQTNVRGHHIENTSMNGSTGTVIQSEIPKLTDNGGIGVENLPTNSFKEDEIKNIINDGGGENKIIVKRIEGGEIMDINITDDPTFKSHKTYVIQDNDEEVPTTYYWIGKESSEKDAGEAAAQAVRINSQFQKRINVSKEAEGKESPTFRELFKRYVTKPVSRTRENVIKIGARSMFTIGKKSESEFSFEKVATSDLHKYASDTNEMVKNRCLVFVSNKVYVYCGNAAIENMIGVAERLARVILLKRGLSEIKIIHRIEELPDELTNIREDKLKEFLSEMESVPEKEQIIDQPDNFTPEEVRRILDQTEMCDSGYERFNVEIFKIYGRHEWSLIDWSVKEERSISQHVPIQTLNSEDCYLTDSHSNVGLLIWMGKEAETFVRAESARKAELHLRKRKYDYATPITFVDQEDVRPLQIETLEELVHVIEPLTTDIVSYEQESQVTDNTFKNEDDQEYSSSSASSSSDDEDKNSRK